MGRISRLELENFKSYSGKQVIGPFKESLTAIIGPNGSGKSNLMDAVCFVFGIAARHLRSDKLKDLVWHVVGKGEGKAGRASLAPKSASVTVVYVPDEGEVRGVAAGKELAFSRSVTSAGASVYRINGVEKTWEAYSAALEEINIVAKARNFLVFQGDVESLANKDEKALMQHLEVFCGSADLKESYDSSWKEFIAARDATNDKRVMVNNTKMERKSLRAEKEEADAYALKVSSREAERTQYALWKLYHLESRISKGSDALSLARAALTAAVKEEEDAGARLSELSKTLSKNHKDAASKEKAAAASAKACLKADSSAEDLKMRISALAKRQDELGGARKKAAEQVAEQEAEVAKLQGEIDELKAKLAALDAGTGAAAAAAAGSKKKKGSSAGAAGAAVVVLDDENRAVYNTLKASERQQTADTRQELDELQREQAKDEDTAAKLRETLETLQNRRAELARESATSTERLAQLNSAHARSLAERKEKQEELAHTKGTLEAAMARHAELAEELEEVKNALAAHKDARKRSDNERRLETAVEDLKRLFPGIRGRFVDLVSPSSKKFNLAVTVALGKHMDSVVVNTQAAAFEAISWLRDNKVRPMTFIPLDKVSTKEPDDRLSTLINRSSSPYRFVRDIVKFDPELEAAVMFAAGTTVVCDTLPDAVELGYKKNYSVKCVTLDGTVIAKNGNMTGGVSSADKELASAGRWDEKEIKGVQQRRDALLQEEEGLRRKLARSNKAGEGASLHTLAEDLQNSLSTNSARLGVVTAEVDRLTKRVKELSAEIANIDKAIAENQPSYDDVTARLATRAAQIAKATASVNGIADKVFGTFCAKLGLESIRSYEVAVVERQEVEAKQRRELSDTLTKLSTKLDYTRSLNRAKLLADITARIADNAKQLTALASEEAAAREAAVAATLENQKAIAELAALREGTKDREAEREAAARAKRTAGEKKAGVAKEVTSLESSLERFRGERHDELLKCQMEEVKLPVRASSSSSGTGTAATRGGGRRSSSSRMDESEEADDDDDDEDASEAAPSSRGRGAKKNNAQQQQKKKPSASSTAMDVDGDSGVFSQTDITQTTSEEAGGGGLKDEAEEADVRRSDRIDFDALNADGQEVDASPAVIEERSAAYERRIHDMEVEIAKLKPNMKAGAALEEVEARLRAEIADHDAAKEASEACGQKHTDIKSEREKLFVRAFDAVADCIGGIYKEMTVSNLHPHGGEATLTLLSRDEPFDPNEGGIRYTVSPPGKKYSEITVLSGGERTIAALALLFALQFYRPAPFLIMDEIDAALDPSNVQKMTAYIRNRASGRSKLKLAGRVNNDDDGFENDDVQIIVISLKDVFFEQANGIIGVYRDAASNSSRTISLDVDQYPEA